ncbi:MAG TPA: YpdA family putative bacillithiol disulfide reductase [Saprospiraceae bacterium]|nr:YpdA family putative bacillithiol disulfide reductase [Saprospiraceae bacterium]HPN68646.1 YpdA family putative bacillithiol disulfide reductase [Saprospiraceae bacterium]
MQKVHDIAIIGGGPTGINCAIEAKKRKLDTIILEKGVLVNSVFNFPANMTFFSTSLKLEIGEIPFISNNDKPTRSEALEYYRRLVAYYKLNIVFRCRVKAIENKDKIFHIETGKETYFAKKVIVCTGFYDTPKLLNIPGEDLPKVKHYYDEAHPYIGQKIVIIGGANSACDVALETWSKGAEVTMVVKDSQLYQNVKYWILPNVENRIKEGSIVAHFNSEVIEIKEDVVLIKTPDGIIALPNDYVLAMTGYLPDYPLLANFGLTFSDDDKKVPICDEETLETKVKGMYVAGVLNSGMDTNKLFIENTRHHPDLILSHIQSEMANNE